MKSLLTIVGIVGALVAMTTATSCDRVLNRLKGGADDGNTSTEKVETVKVVQIVEKVEKTVEPSYRPPRPVPTPAPRTVDNPMTGNLTLSGPVGGTSAYMTLSYGSGKIKLKPGGNRDLNVASYDEYSGQLLVNAYLNGQYIGYYDGKLSLSGSSARYKGIFYNENKGGKVNFNLTN